MNSAKIVIVGTGPSGIAAATKLLELGFEKVYLLEAQNRIGGRIKTVPFGNNVVDLGAQWCHGEKNNVVYELASPHNLLEPTGDALDKLENIRSNRDKLSPAVERPLKEIYKDITESLAEGLVGYEGSLGAYVTNKFSDKLQKSEYSNVDRAIAQEFLETYKKIDTSVIGSDTLEDASALGMLEYWECEGDQKLNWKEKGFKTLLRLLLRSDEKGTELGVLDERIMFNKRVKTIVWNDGDKVKLICEDDDEILADHVIVTVSLGVLKEKHTSLFDPNLPKEKVHAIEGIAFGTINKMILEFPSEFWPSDWTGFTLLWREEDLKEFRGTDREWLADVFIFNPVVYKPRLLFGWLVGPSARRMEALPEKEVVDGCMYLLRRFLPWDIPEPVKFIRSQWSTNQNFRGTYSYRSMMTEAMNVGAVDLAEPIKNGGGKPLVLFAGEATSRRYFSTVHGAVESGWREAERLAKIYKDETEK